MNNPLDMFKMIKNPQEFVMNYAKSNFNPIVDNLIKMAQSNDKKGLENFARNVLKEKGQDFDKIMSNFK